MFDSLSFRIGLIAILSAVIFCTGWTVRGWKNDSEQAAIDRAANAIIEKATINESGIAAKVESRLAELKANQTVIDRGVIREIQKPIYRNVCFQPDLVRMLNDAARGDKAPPDPGKPSGQVPGVVNPAK